MEVVLRDDALVDVRFLWLYVMVAVEVVEVVGYRHELVLELLVLVSLSVALVVASELG